MGPNTQRRALVGLTAAAAGLLLSVSVLPVLPILLVPTGRSPTSWSCTRLVMELYKARNDLRGTLVQVLAAGLVVIGWSSLPAR
jgi:hypothetical protein